MPDHGDPASDVFNNKYSKMDAENTEFTKWLDEVMATHRQAPADLTTADRFLYRLMFEDGLDPEDAADPAVRNRYASVKRRQSTSHNLADYFKPDELRSETD